jgi:hypothetical protein
MQGSHSNSGSSGGRPGRFWLKSIARAFARPPEAPGFRYHFYLLGRDDQILGTLERRLPDDEQAMAYARTLAAQSQTVEVLRGALVLGRVRPSGETAAA